MMTTVDPQTWQIEREDPRCPDVEDLLREHLTDMFATSPADSVHALDRDALARPDITFWTARHADVLLGVVALKHLDRHHAEIKSMRTAQGARGRGVAGSLMDTVMTHARSQGYRRISLETGSQDYFAAARSLYARFGFEECGPFADYRPDPNSIFMTKALIRR